jgi:monoterpene epsilon-lactone hydrolase
MSLSLSARFWRFFLRKALKKQRLTIAENRARGVQYAKYLSRVPKDMRVERIDIDGLRAAWVRPAGADKNKVVLYLHGGGYVSGSMDTYLMLCIPMAQTLQMNILLPDYRLAPEHPFPAALEDALTAYRWLLANGTSPSDIIITGDSAGGGLSVAATLALRAAVESVPAAVVCMSPWVDLTCTGKSHLTKAETESMLSTAVLKEWAACYTDETNFTNPLVSPVYADFHGLPPLLIQVGSEEILLDDSLALAEKAKVDGVEVTLKVWDGLFHVWPALGNLIPESRMAFDEMRQFLNGVIART